MSEIRERQVKSVSGIPLLMVLLAITVVAIFAFINLDMSKVYSKEITLVTSYAASDDDTKTALELIESSEIDVKQLITHTYSISDTQKAFDHAKTGDKAMKIIITK